MIKDLYGLMLRYGFKPNHKMDQNFCIDDNILKKVITLLDLKKEDVILEIGPGLGFLTKDIVKHVKRVVVVEKDPIMTKILEKEVLADNLIIIEDDFLKVDISEIKPTKIVGFIPYSISQEILEKINGSVPSFLIVQREYAEKVTAYEGFSNYVAQSVLAQSYAKIKMEGKIKRNSFFPVPPCESAIISLHPIEKKQDELYNKFVKGIFRYPNKDLMNAISFGKKEKDYIFTKVNLDKIKEKYKTQKVKSLSVKEIKEIYKTIK